MKIILASASERREELLRRITDKFEIMVSDFDETQVEFKSSCSEYVMDISYGKAKCIADNIKEDAIVIGCDTVVYYDGKVLGKPQNEKEAFDILKKLSGKSHKVFSGITLINTATNEAKRDYVCTDVVFSTITNKQIETYIKTREPMDKAGSYGIQGFGGVFVKEIHGCYYNVVGLPINKLYFMFSKMGVKF